MYDDYAIYTQNEHKPYSRENYMRFWKLVTKYYTKEEWDSKVKEYFKQGSMWDGKDDDTPGLHEET